jgi:ABC-type lipoprotein export system ATPase subunit
MDDAPLDQLVHDGQSRAAERGQAAALIESFGIRQLYGYRTISLSSEYAATIIIARNGVGKTTLMSVLDAFLRLQFNRLRNLEFGEIFCRLRGISDELTLTHDDLIDFLQIPTEGEIVRLAGRAGVQTEIVFNFLMLDFESFIGSYYSHAEPLPVAQKIFAAFGHDPARAVKACREAYAALFQRTARLQQIRATITTVLEHYEVVYLPTYRRVELPLSEENADRSGRRVRRPRVSMASDSLYAGEIQFGLSDIQDRLARLNQDILVRSNNGYREISENIINELIRGFEVSETTPIPKPEELRLFFDRLKSGGRHFGPYYPITAPDFERIYSGEGVPPESRKFLSYFLGKLSGIIQITKDIEEPVELFVGNCNNYLASSEPSTAIRQLSTHPRLQGIDSKILRMDRTDLSVHVESVPYRTPISLDALSSGEKQMISLLAKLYLYPRQKIVLIDEPELSLSIDWQREILVDVLLSPLCAQVIAITHSPFVFDNALEPFARSLNLEVEANLQLELGLDKDLPDASASPDERP